MKNTKDCFGNEIELGKTYGYISDRNGYTTIKTGKARNFSKTDLVTIDVETHAESYQNGIIQQLKDRTHITVKPCQLFPIK